MKKVLCFGDSNTFGYIPESGARYDKDTRWSGILKSSCRTKFSIIEAGCNNRNGFMDNPYGVAKTGYKILPSLLEKDLFCVVLAIGINDLQRFYNPTLDDVKNGIRMLIHIVKENSPEAKIIVVAPSKLSEDVLKGGFAVQFDKTSIEKSQHIGEIYESVATEENCGFINLDDFVKYSPVDGLHYTPASHKIIAEKISELLYSL